MTPATSTSRPMTESDIPGTVAIDALCQGHPWSAGSFREELARGGSGFARIREGEGGEIAGYICAWVSVDELHVGTVGVRPDLRRRGIGKSLVEEALAWGRERGAAAAHLEVRAGNAPAIALYEGLGYHRVGVRRGYYPDNGEDAHLLFLDFLEARP